MIFTMTFPLLEVALHTYKETLKLQLNQFGVPYHDNVTSPVFTKVQPMEPSNTMEVQRFDKEWVPPDIIHRYRLKRRTILCEHLLDRVLPLSAAGLHVHSTKIGQKRKCFFSGFTLGFCAIGVMAHFSSPPEPSNCFWLIEKFGNFAGNCHMSISWTSQSSTLSNFEAKCEMQNKPQFWELNGGWLQIYLQSTLSLSLCRLYMKLTFRRKL